MSRASKSSSSVVGRRIRETRERAGWSQERVGVAIGIDESSSRARISRYELGVHEPPIQTAKLIAAALGVPLTYLYCEEDEIAELLLRLHLLRAEEKRSTVQQMLTLLR